MRIGIPRENVGGERRVGLTPQAVSLLADAGHRVFVESGAGEGAGYGDEAYREAGAELVYGQEEAFGRAELIAKIAPVGEEEALLLGTGQIVFGFHHGWAPSPRVAKLLSDRRITIVSYERIESEPGNRPFQNLLSEIAGSVAVLKAVQYLMSDSGGVGLAPGFVWGVPPATIVVVGCGVAGSQAVRTAVGIGASVVALDRDLERLRELDRLHAGRVVTTMANRPGLARAVRSADVLILAVSEDQAIPIVTREMVRSMRPRSVLVDLAVADGGAAETSRPTTGDEPAFVDEEVTHLCLPNLASLVGRSASRALSNVAVGYLLQVADQWPDGWRENAALGRGILCEAGVMMAHSGDQPASIDRSRDHHASAGNGRHERATRGIR
jgi:alanine dehydrogenase